MTVEPRTTKSAAPPAVFILGAGAPDEVHRRRWWPRAGWSLWVLAAVVVLLTTGGGVELTSGHAPPPSASAAASVQLEGSVSGTVRIEDSKWTQLSGGGPRQVLVSYRAGRSRSAGTVLLAWSDAAKRWVSVYRGTRVTRDVLVPAGSALDGEVAVGLIDAVDRLSDGAYDIATSPANVALVEVWMDHEGGLWADNPLNTSYDASAYPQQITTSGQDTGIPIYPNLSVGVTDTALTLLGNPDYSRILKVLASGSGSCTAFGAAVVESPWAASHYGYDAGSFCPSGQSADLTVDTPLAPRGVHEPSTPETHRQPSLDHGASHEGSVHGGSAPTASVVGGAPVIRGDS